MTSPAQRVFARSSRSLINFDMSCGGRLHADSRLNKWDLLMSSVSMSRISSISTSIASVGGSYSFCSSSYSHISTASRFRMRLIWCEPYLAVRNFSRRSFTSPFSVKLTRSPVRPGDRSQSFMVSTPHCISARLLVVHRRRVRVRVPDWSRALSQSSEKFHASSSSATAPVRMITWCPKQDLVGAAFPKVSGWF